MRVVDTDKFFDCLKAKANAHIQSGGVLETSGGPSTHGNAVTLDFIPPKQYTFSEAYAMMKQGKWMKPVVPYNGNEYQYTFSGGELYRRRSDGTEVISDMPGSFFQKQWEEVQP